MPCRPRLVRPVAFPYLLLLVSGGHCQLLAVRGVGDYRRLGATIDDAAGEAFDKTAKLLGLGFPGGPAVEQAAKGGDAARFALPRPMLGRAGCDFSFSGLKTAVRQMAAALPEMKDQDRADMAASFQAAVADVLVDRCRHAMAQFRDGHGARRSQCWWWRAVWLPIRCCAGRWLRFARSRALRWPRRRFGCAPIMPP